MKVICIMTIYNEIDFLPYKLEWCHRNGLDLYVIDNYSTDGSYEWLKDHNIDCHQIDTKGTFDLPTLQAGIIRTVDHIKPDWVVYNGADLFIFAERPIATLCMEAERMGKNTIGFPIVGMHDTGEEPTGGILNTYFWYMGRMARTGSLKMIEFVYKWKPGIKYSGDTVKMPNKKTYNPSGIMINYGRIKSPERRKELLERRKLAWQRGMDRGHGIHYLTEEKRGFKRWDKSELKDIRESEYWQYLKDYISIT